VVKTIETVADQLRELWTRRRDDPLLISQPSAQWPNLDSPFTSGFRGYQPGTSHLDAGGIMGNVEFGTRITAAGVTGHNLEAVWQGPEDG
jgi:hypothetical protein